MVRGKWDLFLTQVAEEGEVAQFLLVACKLNAPIKVVEYLLDKKHADPNERFAFDARVSALSSAIAHANSDVALLLLYYGAYANDKDKSTRYGYTLLMQTCAHAKLLPVTRRMVEELKRCGGGGGDLNRFSPGEQGVSALTLCCSQPGSAGLEQAGCLLAGGALPNLAPNGGSGNATALYVAVSMGSVPLAKLLIEEYGADVGGQQQIWEALGDAARRPDVKEPVLVELLDLLAAQHGASSTDMFVKFYVEQQQQRPFPELTRRWIELGANVADGGALLVSAARHGRVYDVALFLQLGADPNSLDGETGELPLLAALEKTYPDQAAAAATEIVKLLILAGAALDHEGVLVKAIASSNAAVVRMLIQAGADTRAEEGVNLIEYARVQLPEVVPWLQGAEGLGEFDPEGKGLGFVFTHCAGCRKPGDGGNLHGCSACVMVAYWGEECQLAHWKQHKPICKRKREIDEERRQMRA